jgi:putative SOS response-associated peptidase YedK
MREEAAMCGRFTLTLDPGDLQDELNFDISSVDLAPRYNIAPSQPVAAVRDGSSRKVELFRWGLVPSWAKDPAIGFKMINARSETISEKPSFRVPFSRRRCLIPADGFYEWAQGEGGKIPYYFYLKDHKPFTFAGLWEEWLPKEGGEALRTCTIITTAANEVLKQYHERMPVILPADVRWLWLDPSARVPELQSWLKPYPAGEMAWHEVSRLVNKPGVDSSELIAPAGGLI